MTTRGLLDFKELRRYCAPRGIDVDENGRANFKDGSNAIVDLAKPTLVNLLSQFAVVLAKAIPPGPRLYDFPGAILWVGETGVWDDESENAGKLMFESLRPGRETIEQVRGQFYRPDEWIS